MNTSSHESSTVNNVGALFVSKLTAFFSKTRGEEAKLYCY